MSSLIIGGVIGLLAAAFTRKIFFSIGLFIFNWMIAYAALPVINFNFYGLPVLLLLNGIAIVIREALSEEMFRDEINKTGMGFGISIGVVGLTWCIIVPAFTTWSVFHASEYRNLIGNVQEGTFSTETSPVDITQVRTVDQALAARLAEKRLGEDTALGSQVNVGTMRIQEVRGELYWVGPLDHSGFFKWWSNSRGTPGYMMVSATNERDVRLVQEVGEQKIFLKYNNNCYFGNHLPRYLYQHGYMTRGLDDYTFEIDDDGHPYWVVTLYEKKVGFGGEDAVGVAVVDATNGDISEYTTANAPAWIDRIQPESFVVDQLNDWGRYVHGWWNPSNRDMLKATPGTSLVYGEDGKSYWYTGITSVGADEGTVGFVLVDTRTKEARLYRQAGATETAARGSAQGAVQEKGYVATFPILYNVSGVPTYFTTLKDNAGLVKMMAWISVEDYNVVGVGENVREALREYRRKLMSRGNDLAPDSTVERQAIEALVARIGRDGSNFYFLLEEKQEKLFVASPDLSNEIVMTLPGDRVRIEYDEGGNELVDMASFDNLGITLQKTVEQRAVEDRGAAVRERRQSERAGQNADAAWDDLSPDEKEALLRGRQ